MIRIKTKINNDQVYTMFYFGRWLTITTVNGKTSSIESNALWQAGQKHLDQCVEVKKHQEQTS